MAAQRDPWADEPEIPDDWADIVDSDDDAEPSPAQCAQLLVDLLVDCCLRQDRFDAIGFCIIAHWALKGGCADPVSKIALHPAASSGRFKRKLRSYLKLDRDVDQTYTVYAPGYSKAEMSRVQLALPFMPPYELLHKEWCESENLDERLQECIDSGDMPLTYDSHPVV